MAEEGFIARSDLATVMAVPTEILHGIALFNRQQFFEAHEAWEDHWGKGSAEERNATLGLIKAAVALHHLAGNNGAGFAWQAGEAVKQLRANASVWPELRLEALAEELESLAAQVRFHGRVAPGFAWPLLTFSQ